MQLEKILGEVTSSGGDDEETEDLDSIPSPAVPHTSPAPPVSSFSQDIMCATIAQKSNLTDISNCTSTFNTIHDSSFNIDHFLMSGSQTQSGSLRNDCVGAPYIKNFENVEHYSKTREFTNLHSQDLGNVSGSSSVETEHEMPACASLYNSDSGFSLFNIGEESLVVTSQQALEMFENNDEPSSEYQAGETPQPYNGNEVLLSNYEQVEDVPQSMEGVEDVMSGSISNGAPAACGEVEIQTSDIIADASNCLNETAMDEAQNYPTISHSDESEYTPLTAARSDMLDPTSQFDSTFNDLIEGNIPFQYNINDQLDDNVSQQYFINTVLDLSKKYLDDEAFIDSSTKTNVGDSNSQNPDYIPDNVNSVENNPTQFPMEESIPNLSKMFADVSSNQNIDDQYLPDYCFQNQNTPSNDNRYNSLQEVPTDEVGHPTKYDQPVDLLRSSPSENYKKMTLRKYNESQLRYPLKKRCLKLSDLSEIDGIKLSTGENISTKKLHRILNREMKRKKLKKHSKMKNLTRSAIYKQSTMCLSAQNKKQAYDVDSTPADITTFINNFTIDEFDDLTPETNVGQLGEASWKEGKKIVEDQDHNPPNQSDDKMIKETMVIPRNEDTDGDSLKVQLVYLLYPPGNKSESNASPKQNGRNHRLSDEGKSGFKPYSPGGYAPLPSPQFSPSSPSAFTPLGGDRLHTLSARTKTLSWLSEGETKQTNTNEQESTLVVPQRKNKDYNTQDMSLWEFKDVAHFLIDAMNDLNIGIEVADFSQLSNVDGRKLLSMEPPDFDRFALGAGQSVFDHVQKYRHQMRQNELPPAPPPDTNPHPSPPLYYQPTTTTIIKTSPHTHSPPEASPSAFYHPPQPSTYQPPTTMVASYAQDQPYVYDRPEDPRGHHTLYEESDQEDSSDDEDYEGDMEEEEIIPEVKVPDPPKKRGPGRPPKPDSERKKKKKKDGRLWEFIRNLLLNPETCPSMVKWEDAEEGIFRFTNSEKVAERWGSRKNNGKMNYEKLSRAMRYYYKGKIFEPVLGKRLVYKFGVNAKGWKPNQGNFDGH